MLAEIFLPEKIGSHRILAQRIIGLSVHEDSVRLALVHAKHNKTIVQNLLTEQIEPGPEETYFERAATALKKIIAEVKSYDQIRICIPASIVVLKELVLQFTDSAKIRMVLEYEIETMLPFSINEAIVDFVITKTQKDPAQAQVLVAAVRNLDLQAYLNIFTSAGIDPTHITIDLFALYGLYQQIPEYNNELHATALVELGSHATRVAFIQNGQLRLSRSIQRGVATILTLISNETKIPVNEIKQKLATSGIGGITDESLSRAIQKHFVLLLNDIQFTLNSFSLKLNFYDGVNKVLFTGYIQAIKNLMRFCSDTMQIPCEVFDCKKLFENKLIKNSLPEEISDWGHFAIALGVALPSPEQSDFDLRRKQFAFQQHGLVTKQLATASILVLCLFAAIGIKGYFDLHSLSKEAKNLEIQEINSIRREGIFEKDRFPKKPTLQIVLREAEKIVKEKQEIWAPFAQQRLHPLELWSELTRIINKRQFDVTIKEIVFTTEEKGWDREKDGSAKRDSGIPKLEVEGLFKSKTGSHFADFMIFQNRFQESATLQFITLTEDPATDGGVDFNIKMKLKEV